MSILDKIEEVYRDYISNSNQPKALLLSKDLYDLYIDYLYKQLEPVSINTMCQNTELFFKLTERIENKEILYKGVSVIN
jgi:hypothetical protein